MEILAGKRIGFALTGSFCTFADVFVQVQALVDAGADVTPILSYHVDQLDTRFFKADEVKRTLEKITGKKPLKTLMEVEPIGPKKTLDLVIIAPCTGNSLGKLQNGIIDTPVIMAVKSHLRNQRPVLLAVSTNDGLTNAAKNIGGLMNTKHIYFVPYGQDDYQKKANSLVADMTQIPMAAAAALRGEQLQPMLYTYS